MKKAGLGLVLLGLFLGMWTVPRSVIKRPLDPWTRWFEVTCSEIIPQQSGDWSACEAHADSPLFAGLSALEYDHKRKVLWALSDRGYWLRMRPGISGWAAAGSFKDPAYYDKGGFVADAEGLALLKDGSLAVSFEDHKAVKRYEANAAHLLPRLANASWVMPGEVGLMPSNGNFEALTALADGRLLAFTERPIAGTHERPVYILSDRAPVRMHYEATDGYEPAGADTLENGDIILLTRRPPWLGGWFSARIELVRKDELKAGAVLKPRVIQELAAPMPIDNYEGVTILGETADHYDLLLVSDENQYWFQKILFLKLRVRK